MKDSFFETLTFFTFSVILHNIKALIYKGDFGNKALENKRLTLQGVA